MKSERAGNVYRYSDATECPTVYLRALLLGIIELSREKKPRWNQIEKRLLNNHLSAKTDSSAHFPHNATPFTGSVQN